MVILDTYTIALERLKKLQVNSYAFTSTDDDVGNEEKQQCVENIYKAKALEKNAAGLLSACRERFAAKNSGNLNLTY